MPGDQNAGRSQDIKIDSDSFERVEDFKYLGTTLTISYVCPLIYIYIYIYIIHPVYPFKFGI